MSTSERRSALLGALLLVSIFDVSGCTFEPIDHEGQLAPCLDGFEPDDEGRCRRADDAGAPRDALPDGTQADAPACAPLACEGDELVRCEDGTPVRLGSRCEGDVLSLCRGGELLTLTCPDACTSDPVARCAIAPSSGVSSSGLDGRDDLVALVVGADTTLTIDTDSGRITRTIDAVTDELRPAGTGVLAGIGFAFVDGAAPVGVLFVRSLSVSGLVRGAGARALAIVAQELAIVGETGSIDVSADGTLAGPGGSASGVPEIRSETMAGCSDFRRSSAGEGAGAGGGAAGTGYYGGGGGGAGHGRAGGAGGRGGSSCAPGGLAGAVFGDDALIGGSSGGAGADRVSSSSGSQAAIGGGGGGALQLVAGVEVRVAGVLDASGGGGQGGLDYGGGAGGGAGGLVWIEAPRLELVPGSAIGANGGGGGAGGARECDPPTPATSEEASYRYCVAPPPEGLGGADGAARALPAGGGAPIENVSADATSTGVISGGGGRGSDSTGTPGAAGNGDFNGSGGGGAGGRIVLRSASGAYDGAGALAPSEASGLVRLESLAP